MLSHDERAERLRRLLALEIARIVDDLELRRDFLVRMWSKHRDRQPFLDSVFHRWRSVGFPDLAEFETDQVVAIDAFFRKVDEFRLYACYTQDMPTGLSDRLDSVIGRLRTLGEAAIDALGGLPERPAVLDDETREGFLLAFPMGDPPVSTDDAAAEQVQSSVSEE